MQWAPASTVCLVHIRPVLEEKLTGQKRILHGEIKEEMTVLEVEF